jgi:hypothetical protein
LDGFGQAVELFGGGQKFEQAVFGFSTLLRVIAVQTVQARPSMGVNQGDASLFLHKVAHGGEQCDVFEHIGMVARVKSVSVTEHGLMVTNNFCKSLIFRIMAGFAAILWPRGEDA